MAYVERIWIGPAYSRRRIFVLGESWYGDYQGDLATDDGYIRAYLDDRLSDALYTRIANACEIEKQAFWEGIMFTNFVQRVALFYESKEGSAFGDQRHRARYPDGEQL